MLSSISLCCYYLLLLYSERSWGSVGQVGSKFSLHGVNPSLVVRGGGKFGLELLLDAGWDGASWINGGSRNDGLESFEVRDSWSICSCDESLSVTGEALLDDRDNFVPVAREPFRCVFAKLSSSCDWEDIASILWL